MNTLKGMDILRADQLSLDEIELIMQTAARFERVIQDGGQLSSMSHKVLATLFYEPSTRTRLSFESAMTRLGGLVLSVAEARTSSSAVKGETLFDTGKMIESYADVAVIRHPAVGSAEELAEGAGIPIINGGDGAGEHPTQALLDLYTIRKEKQAVEGLTVALIGDLKNGRTVHSLSKLLSYYRIRFYFVSPKSLAMPSEITSALCQRGIEVVETTDLIEATSKSDVIYVTRIQKERFESIEDYERLKGVYVIDRKLLDKAKPGLTIMHPLPRINEISREVDEFEGAAYFRQAANGVPVRMSLLALVAGWD